MAWIESHQTLARHPKLCRLAADLGVRKAEAIGLLHCLWWWALDFAPDGDLSAYDPTEVEIAIEWHGSPGALHAALVQRGWIDADNRIHDWQDYGGRFIAIRTANRERQRKFRARNAESNATGNGGSHVSHALRNGYITRNRTGQDRTGPKKGMQGESPIVGEPEKPKRRAVARPTIDDAEWIGGLEGNAAYQGLNVREQIARCRVWCETNGKACSRRRIVNWLNRAERPVNGHALPAQAQALPLWQQRRDLEAEVVRLKDELGRLPAGDERSQKIARLRELEQKAKGMGGTA